MKELSLHILDIAENSVTANASKITISIHEDLIKDEINIQIIDNGKGIKKEMLDIITDPFVTTRTTRKVGLGIPLLKAAAEEANGRFEIKSEVNKGTSINATFQRSHIDRMPLGDINGTFLSLIISNPEIDWEFNYSVNDKKYTLESSTLKEILGDVPLTEPCVLKYIRTEIKNGIDEVKKSIMD